MTLFQNATQLGALLLVVYDWRGLRHSAKRDAALVVERETNVSVVTRTEGRDAPPET